MFSLSLYRIRQWWRLWWLMQAEVFPGFYSTERTDNLGASNVYYRDTKWLHLQRGAVWPGGMRIRRKWYVCTWNQKLGNIPLRSAWMLTKMVKWKLRDTSVFIILGRRLPVMVVLLNQMVEIFHVCWVAGHSG